MTIDPSLIGEDKDMLEDLVAAAVNDAVRRVEAATQEKMAGLTDGHADAARVQAAVLTDVGPTTRSGCIAASEPVSGLDALAKALRCLPGVGPKAAQRMALHLLQHDRDGAQRLATRARPMRPSTSATASAATRSPRMRSARCAGRASAIRRCCASSRRRPIC